MPHDVQVVKNVASSILEVKKLVYIYLLHYAEKYALLRTLFTGMHLLCFSYRPMDALEGLKLVCIFCHCFLIVIDLIQTA